MTIGLFTFVGDTRVSVDYNQRTNEWSLIIQDVKPSDEGTYKCQISTKQEHMQSYDIELNVKSKSPITISRKLLPLRNYLPLVYHRLPFLEISWAVLRVYGYNKITIFSCCQSTFLDLNKRFKYCLFIPTCKYAFSNKSFEKLIEQKTLCTKGFKIVGD